MKICFPLVPVKIILYLLLRYFSGRIDMKLKFERCTAESLVEMFRHYFDTDLPEGKPTLCISHLVLIFFPKEY
jgi:hypothetical protein